MVKKVFALVMVVSILSSVLMVGCNKGEDTTKPADPSAAPAGGAGSTDKPVDSTK